MEKVLIVIDMQNDFISGSLGTKEAQSIVPYVVDKVKNFKGRVIFTRDTHESNYLETSEGKHLPVPHCIKGTNGWEICDELKPLTENAVIINKPTFGSKQLLSELAGVNSPESIELCGLCTDICVVTNALLCKTDFKEIPIIVDSKACAGVTPETHNAALQTMKMCQVEIV